MAARLVITRKRVVNDGVKREGFFTIPKTKVVPAEVAFVPIGGCREFLGTGCAGDDSRDEVTP